MLVQMSVAMTAHAVAEATVAASARRVALGADPLTETARLTQAIETIVPGSSDVDADVIVTTHLARVTARFSWTPPGPVFTELEIATSVEVPRAVPP